MMYKVTKQYGRGHEQEVKKFKDVAEAKSFIADELSHAASLKINVLFRLYEGMDLLEEFDPSKQEQLTNESDNTSSASGMGSGASFRPTPFNTAPTPKGLPKNWVKDGNEKENGDK